MADYSIINTTPSTLLIRDIYDNAIQGFTNDLSAVLQYSDVKMEFFRGTAHTEYLQHTTSTAPLQGYWTATGNIANYFIMYPGVANRQDFPFIGSKVSNIDIYEGNCQPGWLACHPAQNSTNDPNLRLAIKITPLNNKKITGYRLYYQDQDPSNNAVGIDSGQNGSLHQSTRIFPRNKSNQGNFTYIGNSLGYANVYRYEKLTLSPEVTSAGHIYVHIDAGADGLAYDSGTIRLDLEVVDPYAPTTLLFVNNTLTVTNDISGTDLDLVSFQLPAGSIMYSFNVTSLLNANSITYSLKISGGANVSSGTITSTGVNLLGGNNLTPAVDTTYILTLTSGSTNTYTIIGKMLGPGYTLSGVFAGGGTIPWNSISNSNAFGKSYVNNFVDLSGDIIIRKDGALIVDGDVSMGGNLIMTTPSTSKLIINDLSLNSRLFIGKDPAQGSGNVSIQGNVNIGGDVSINKQFSGNFADGIIPISAIINYPSSGGDVTITGKVQTLGDVSFNGTTLQVGSSSTMKINGNLILPDQTIMSSYDNNISSGTFAQGNVIFKDSRFDSVVVLGAATVTGTITATSDYRIKENVEDLDSSFTLDSLTPVEYDNVLSGNHEYGVIAHEMQATYPFLVQGEKDGPEYQRVSYPGLIGVMVNEVKTLKQNLDALKTRI
jgi:hypothetical protein